MANKLLLEKLLRRYNRLVRNAGNPRRRKKMKAKRDELRRAHRRSNT